MKKILFVVNTPEFFLSHRLPIALAAKKKGMSVHIATGSGKSIPDVEEFGFKHHLLPISRKGQNPFLEIKTLFLLFRLFKKEKPDLVHLVTIKPVVYGGLAARLARINAVVAAISGLGTVFLAQNGLKNSRRLLVTQLYRAALKQNKLTVIFQNPDDKQLFIDSKIVSETDTQLIRGSGVDLEDYQPKPEPNGVPVVVFAARLLKDKGIFEFVEAARILKKRKLPVVMRVIGDSDPGNVSSVTESELNMWREENIVELSGYKKDISKEYAAAHIVCLPSYREGLPKSLVEAAACGRAVITSNVTGCRDAIESRQSGILVPVKDALKLADAIEFLVNNKELRIAMGVFGRDLAEREFSIDKIVDQHLAIYNRMLNLE